MKNEVHYTWHFKQSPEEVWEYLTKPELLEQWLMKTDFKPIVGQKFHFSHPQGGMHYCEVLEIKPFSKLVYSWKKDNMPVNSKVTWTLEPKGNGTELQLVHNGFVVLKDYTDHNKGWSMLVGGLVERLSLVK